MTTIRGPRLTGMVLLATLTSACADLNGPIFGSSKSKIRVVSVAPFDFTVFVNGAAKGSPSFGNDVGCIEVNAKSPGLGIVLTGGSLVLSYVGGFYDTSHTVLVTGTPTGTTTGITTVVQFRELPNSYTAPAGKGGVRVVNALMSGSYDVYFTTSGSPLTTPSIAAETPTYTTLFAPLVAGSWDVKVTLAGTQTVVADLGSVIVGGGNITVVIGPPAAGSPGVRVFMIGSSKDC